MESRDSISTDSGDYSAAVPLEISNEIASRADDLLREFAEDSGLETALIVDRSGALVAGISAEAEVTIEVISALVAGASGAMRALVSQLGETGAMESLHLGGERMIYLREIVNRFILVGVAKATSPAGLVRSKAHRIEGDLTELLRDVRPAEVPLSPPAEGQPRSLREVAQRRAAERLLPVAVPAALETEPEDETGPEKTGPDETADTEEIMAAEEAVETGGDIFFGDEEIELEFEPVFESEPFIDLEPLPIEPAVHVEPREILEPLDFGEPEIVIEPSAPAVAAELEKAELPVDSPFEVEMEESDDSDDFEEEEADEPVVGTVPSESVFELEFAADDEEDDDEDATEEDDEEESFELAEPEPPASFFELLEEDEDDEEEDEEDEEDEPGEADFSFEVDDSEELEESEDPESPKAVVEAPEPEAAAEADEPVEAEQAGDSVFEVEEDEEIAENEEDSEDIGEEIQEMIAEEEEESEVRSSGPFYF